MVLLLQRSNFLLSLFPSCLALSSAGMVLNGEIAVIGCGVLGTSLCKQLIEAPEFSAASGESVITRHWMAILDDFSVYVFLPFISHWNYQDHDET